MTSLGYTLSAELLAAALADDPQLVLPNPLPCAPLALLRALHNEALDAMESDVSRAEGVAAAAWRVVQINPADPLLKARAHWTSGSAILYKPAYVESLAHYDAALVAYERARTAGHVDTDEHDVRVVHINRVFCLSELARYDEASAAVGAAEAWLAARPGAYHARLTLLLNQSQLAGRMGDYRQMLALADTTVELGRRHEIGERIAHGLLNRGDACLYLGLLDQAAQAIAEGIATAAQVGAAVTVGRGLLLRAILRSSSGQLFAALGDLQLARASLAQAPNEVPTLEREQARLYQQVGDVDRALLAASRAAEGYAQLTMKAYAVESALAAARMALAPHPLGDSEHARRMLALARAQSHGLPTSSLEPELVLTEALLALRAHQESPRGGHKTLRSLYDAAAGAVIALKQRGLAPAADEGQLIVAALGARIGGAPRVAAMRAYRELSASSELQVRLAAAEQLASLLPPAEGVAMLRDASALAVKQRRALPTEELQARYSSHTASVHTQLARCLLALGATEESYNAVTLAKAGPMLDLRAASDALPGGYLAQLERARWEVRHWDEQAHQFIQKAVQAPDAREYLATSQRLRRQREQALDRLTVLIQELGLGDRTGQAAPAASAQIQATLPAGGALLEYVVFDDGEIGAFLLRPGQAIIYRRLGDEREVERLLGQWDHTRGLLREIDGSPPLFPRHQWLAELRARLRPLWRMLLAPWATELAGLTQLLIAPDGPLHQIPWAALCDDAETFLSDRLLLTLTPAGGLWAAPYAPGPPQTPAQVLCFAGHPDSAGAPYLHHAEQEARVVGDVIDGATLIVAATRDSLLSVVAPRILHIIAHGRTNLRAPLTSALSFADGDVLLFEAHRLQLRGTELVVLSACETGVRATYGELVLAQAGAFLCAGARSVLASLWSIDDDAAAAFMGHFYRACAAGSRPAAALCAAQQAIRAAHPVHWGAFQLWEGAAPRPPATESEPDAHL